MAKTKKGLEKLNARVTIVAGGVNSTDESAPAAALTFSTKDELIFLPPAIAAVARERSVEGREGFQWGFLSKDELLEVLEQMWDDGTRVSGEIRDDMPRVNPRLRAVALVAANNAFALSDFIKKCEDVAVITNISRALFAGLAFAEYSALKPGEGARKKPRIDLGYIETCANYLKQRGKRVTLANILELGATHIENGKRVAALITGMPPKDTVKKHIEIYRKKRLRGSAYPK